MSNIENKLRRQTTYVKVTIDSDRLLELTAVWSRIKKQEVIEMLARCPTCNVLLLHVDRGVARCPQCGRRYILTES
ncbi:hypothetical protein [Pyrobaculum sp.]|uniref:hypothetical protein n=1 Tax=Pyrobaculum sp. TaxID=2004705 RepID=UPI003D0CCECA